MKIDPALVKEQTNIMKLIGKNLWFLALVCLSVLDLSPGLVFGQSSFEKEKGSSIYRSEEDDLLTVRKVGILPILDNVGGIGRKTPQRSH